MKIVQKSVANPISNFYSRYTSLQDYFNTIRFIVFQ